MRKLVALLVSLNLLAYWMAAPTVVKAEEETIRPAIVQIQTFDNNGKALNHGSGFFVNEKGDVVTNYHFIEGAYSAIIKPLAGREFSVIGIIGKDSGADIVKLSVKIDSRISFLNLSTSIPAQGQDVVVIGNPLVPEAATTKGIVSVVREIPGFGKVLQITSVVSPRASGSPVINEQGEVIGIAVFVPADGQKTSFIIPSDKILALKETAILLQKEDTTAMVNKDKSQSLFDKGLKQLWQANYFLALTYFTRATESNPKFAEAWTYMGYCHEVLHHPKAQYEACKEAVKNKRNYPLAYLYLGNACGSLGRWQEAIDAYQEAIKFNQDFAQAHLQLGNAYSNIDRIRDASDEFKQATKIKPDYVAARNALGITYVKRHKYPDAIDEFNVAIKIDPNSSEGYYGLGLTYFTLDKNVEAVQNLVLAIKINPDYTDAHYLLGTAYLNASDKSSALEEYQILKGLDSEKANKLFSLIYK